MIFPSVLLVNLICVSSRQLQFHVQSCKARAGEIEIEIRQLVANQKILTALRHGAVESLVLILIGLCYPEKIL